MNKQDWTYKKLGDVATFSRGLTYSKSDVAADTSNKVLRSNNIDLATNSLNFDDVVCLKEEFKIPIDKMLQPNDIFICMSNGSTQHLGKVAFIEKKINYAFGGFMGAIHPNINEIYPKFAYYYCLSSEYRRSLATVLNGININNIKWSDLSRFPIPVPSINEQESIVEELDLLLGIIEKKKAQLKEYDQLAQSIFYSMFGDQLEANSTNYLKDVASYYIGLTYKPTDVSEEGTIVLRSSNIQNNILDYNDIVRVNLNVGENKTVKDGDILMCARNGSARLVGKVARIRNINEKMSFGAFMTIIRSNYNDFLFHFFLSDFFRSQLTTSKTATINQITSRMLDNIKLNVPPLSLQQEFAEKIEEIERQKALVQASIAEMETLFNSRMDYYFG